MKTYARIDNGLVAELFQTDGDITQMFAPGLTWVDVTNISQQPQQNWNYDGKVFVAPDGPSFQAQQTAAWNAIKSKRDAIANGGAEVATSTGVNKWFQTDADSRMQYLGLKDTARDMLAAGHVMGDALQVNGGPVNWKTFDNSFVALTLQNAFDIVAAVKTLDALAFANAETHRENMLKASDPLAYDYSTGWPAVYVAA